MSENIGTTGSRGDTATLEQKDRATELREDFRWITNHLPVLTSLNTRNISLVRPNEHTAALAQVKRDGVLLISGGKGAGKSSLLNEMQGEAAAQGALVVNFDTALVNGNNCDEKIVSQFSQHDIEVGSIEAGIAHLRDHQGILMVDELTPAFATDKQVYAEQLEPVLQLIDLAREEGVPVVTVVHAFPEKLQAVARRYGSSLIDNRVIPRDISEADIITMLRVGSVTHRGEPARQPAVLTVDDDAAGSIYQLAGNKPGVAAAVVSDLYLPYRRLSATPPERISRQVVDTFLDGLTPHSFFTKGAASTMSQRVANIGQWLLKENPDEFTLFRDVFQLQQLDYGKSVIENAQTITTPAQRAIDTEIAEKWKRAGLTREQNGQLIIDGAATAMALSYNLLGKNQ